ncbi:MAG: acetate--CoA ligase family protein [bacterium]
MQQDIEIGIKNFFIPDSIVHIGSTNQEGKPGYTIYKKLLKSGKKIYPVNPKLENIDGKKVYNNVTDIEIVPDIAIISIPAKPTVSVLKECAEKGIKSAVIVAGGFKEAGEEGAKLEEEILNIVNDYGIRVLGPNTLGVFTPEDLYDMIFIDHGYNVINGGVSLITQSGSVGIEALGVASNSGFGLRTFFGLGNKCDVDELDALEYFRSDEKTNSIALYLESINDGRKLIEELGKVSKEKPIVMLKAGRSEAGAGAVASHTGALAGSDNVVEGALKSKGIVRAMDDEELFDFSKVLSLNPAMKGNNVAIITPAGGYGVMLTDYLELESRGYDLRLAKFSEETKNRLKEVVFEFASVHNPIDLTASAGDEMYDNVLRVLTEADEVDAIICVSFFAPPSISDELVRIVAKHKRRTKSKPILALTLYGQNTNEYLKIYDDHEVTAFSSTRRVVRALSVLKERGEFLRKLEIEEIASNKMNDEEYIPKSENIDKSKLFAKEDINKIIDENINNEAKMLDEFKSKKVLELTGFKIPKGYYFSPATKDLIEDFNLNFPVVLKVCSNKIAHKTELGGVKVNINDTEQLRYEVKEMEEKFPKEHFLVEEMVKGDFEIIFGGLKDPDFGMNIMVGMGGIWTEVLQDVSFRPVPITHYEANKMLEELKSDKIFKGFRGKKYPRDKIINMLVKFSKLLDEFKDKISQIDLNPIFLSVDDMIVLDAKIFLENSPKK